jgi:hypothetical protein
MGWLLQRRGCLHDPSAKGGGDCAVRRIQDRRARVAPVTDKTVVTVARVTDASLPDIRVTRANAQRDGTGTGVRYLPSAQVLAELASLGPDLRRLAEDLRDRLSEAGAQAQHERGISLNP